MTKKEAIQNAAEFLFGGISSSYSWVKDAENQVERRSFEFLTDDREFNKTKWLGKLKEEVKRLQEKAAEFCAEIEKAQEDIENANDED